MESLSGGHEGEAMESLSDWYRCERLLSLGDGSDGNREAIDIAGGARGERWKSRSDRYRWSNAEKGESEKIAKRRGLGMSFIGKIQQCVKNCKFAKIFMG